MIASLSSAPLRVLVVHGAVSRAPDVAALVAATNHASNFQFLSRPVDALRVIALATHADDRRQAASIAAADADVVLITLDDEVANLNEIAVTTGIELLAEVGVPVVLMIGFGNEAESDFTTAATWLSQHIRATISIDASATEIVATIQAASAGLVVLEPRVAEALARGSQRGRPRATKSAARAPGESPPLSAREREVLALLAHGHATKNIAHLLGISSHTVKAHVESIFAKFGATTRAEAVAIGVRRGAVML